MEKGAKHPANTLAVKKKTKKHPRRKKSSVDFPDDAPSENSLPKYIELNKELRDKLNDLPEVLQFIQRLQKVIEKQVKKIIKWKSKFKHLGEKNCHNVATQTTSEDFAIEIENAGAEEKSLVEDIKEAAEQAVQNTGFVYDETSGLYYDCTSGYYYNAESRLYYDSASGIYFSYNDTTQSYEYQCQVDPSAVTETESKTTMIKSKRKASKFEKKKTKESKRRRKDEEIQDDLEEGECSEASSTNCDEDGSVSDSSDLTKQWPPCMRMIVESTEIPNIKPGTLYIITCDGGTVGREGTTHSICLPDINVSKHHLKVSYESEAAKYMVVDLGSRNGTLLNGKRISSSKQESEPAEVAHGSKLQLGSTTLLCHIHEGSQTCGHCEPGLLLEEEKEPPLPLGHRKNLNQQFKSELKRLKKQHGLVGAADDSSKLAEGYTDRAERRRVEVGSQNPFEKTESASVDSSIPSENKGFKLLAKMGWKEGQSLGKDGSTGVKEPIQVSSNVGTAGIGSIGVPTPQPSINKSKQSIWKKTQERFDKLPTKSVSIFNEGDSDS